MNAYLDHVHLAARHDARVAVAFHQVANLLAPPGSLFHPAIAARVAWRWLSRQYELPCPAWLAWGLENPLMVWLLRTRVTLERIGLRVGQRIIEIGPGPGRLLLPAARVVGPTGEALGVDLQPRMIEVLEANAERAGLANLRGLVADAATELDAARLLTYKAAGTMADADVAIARLMTSAAADRSVDAALRVSGAEALKAGSALERLSRDVRAVALVLGTEEHQRSIAADAMFRP